MKLDAKGKACPEPVIMVKKAVDKGNNHIEIVVDNKVALQNITKFAKGKNFNVTSEESDTDYIITLSK